MLLQLLLQSSYRDSLSLLTNSRVFYSSAIAAFGLASIIRLPGAFLVAFKLSSSLATSCKHGRLGGPCLCEHAMQKAPRRSRVASRPNYHTRHEALMGWPHSKRMSA